MGIIPPFPASVYPPYPPGGLGRGPGGGGPPFRCGSQRPARFEPAINFLTPRPTPVTARQALDWSRSWCAKLSNVLDMGISTRFQ